MINRYLSTFSLSLFSATVFTLFNVSSFAQMTATFTTTENTNCAGNPCNYEGPGILINEIMISPSVFDGSLWGGSVSQAGEWIELYNPDVCNAVDVSCWYLGNNTNDPVAYGGGFVIPANTIVPPAGFLILRGINMTPVPSDLLVANGGNTLEIVVDEGVCITGGTRLWFPNAGGWFAFYDNLGNPQDAVSWGNQSNIANVPCVPDVQGCTSIGSLINYNSIPADRKNVISPDAIPNSLGQSLRRNPDGASWALGFGSPTYGFCNTDCAEVGNGSDCTGTATVFVEGGTPPYFYFWPNAEGQSEQTAVNLCGGINEVVVFDNLGAFQSFFVEIEEPSFESEEFVDICQGEVYILPNSSPVNQPGEYPIMLQTVNGCDSLVTYNIDVLPTYSNNESVVICPGQTYTMPDGSEVGVAGEYTYVFEMANGCDSTLIVNLAFDPVITISSSPEICQGETYTLPNGEVVSTTGFYEIAIGSGGCDTIYQVNLTVNPSYEQTIPVQLCQGESFTMPDGTVINATGSYRANLSTEFGCDSIIQVLLTVSPLPTPNVNVLANYCYGTGLVPLNPTPPGGVLVGANLIGSNLNLTNAGPGNYPISYTVTDQNGCSNTFEGNYNVTSPIFPQFEYSTYCNSATFTNLTNDPQQDYNYVWQLDSNTVSTETSFTYSFLNSGEFEMVLTVSDDAGCVYATSQLVEFVSALDLTNFLIPNVISANSDNMNDALVVAPVGNECLQYRINIFNRWGKQVYEMTNDGQPFRGISESGAELKEGTYFYIFESPQIDCNNPIFAPYCKGSITLLR
jgi:gliding motility-associated-like protein